MEEKSVYLKKDGNVLQVKAYGYFTDQGFCQVDAGVYLVDAQFRVLAMMYAILGPYESEVVDLKSLGYTEVRPTREV